MTTDRRLERAYRHSANQRRELHRLLVAERSLRERLESHETNIRQYQAQQRRIAELEEQLRQARWQIDQMGQQSEQALSESELGREAAELAAENFELQRQLEAARRLCGARGGTVLPWMAESTNDAR